MYTKNCPKCNSVMNYSTKSNLNKSIKNDSVCKKCVEWTEQRRNKLKIARNNYLENLTQDEKQNQIHKMSNSLKEFWNNKSDVELQQWKQKVSCTSKKRWQTEEYKTILKQKIKDSWDNLTEQEKIARIEKSSFGGAGVCKYYVENGYRVYGKTEQRYIKHLIETNGKMPKNQNRIAVNTPYGLYFPDFEYDDYYVEIKSEYTYSKLINRLSYDGKSINKQIDKIIWTSVNIKKVIILVETRNGFMEGACTLSLS